VPLDLPVADPCPYCEYLAGRRPYTILERDGTTATFVTFEQRGLGHQLVVPIAHRPTIFDLTPDEAVAVTVATRRAAERVRAAYDPEGISVFQNNGRPSHQTVPHLHVHVLGTTLARPSVITGPVDRLPTEATDAIAERLRNGR
jgi:histidine triad (HIT) family protein